MRARSSPRGGRAHEAGFVAVIVALLAVIIIGFLGMAVDNAHVQGAGQQLQDAADAAALSAAAKLAAESSPGGGAYTNTRASAVATAALNKAAGAAVAVDGNSGNSAGGDVVVGTWNSSTSVFTATTTSPNAVKVVARRTAASPGGALPLTFGGVVGVTSSDVSRYSIATITSTAAPFVHVLDPSASGALTMSGNGSLGASGGRVQVNSSSASGISASGNANISATQTCVCGGASLSGNAVISNLKTGAAAVADPLATLLPDETSWNTLKNSMNKPAGANGKISATGVYAPGYYPKGLALSSSSVATLSPGIFMFGTTFKMSGQSKILATNVTILCDSGVKPSLSGGAGLTITPPLLGTYQGLTIMCHRASTGTGVLSLSGNGAIACTGTFYVPGGGVTLSGNGAAQGLGQLICLKLTQSGNAAISGVNIVPAATGVGKTALVR